MTRPLPRCPLFPYTTLFRSDRLLRKGCAARAAPGRDHLVAAARGDPVRADGRGDRARAQDRKSTRLNSSHVKISYAIFCWKKKTPLNQHRRTKPETSKHLTY